MSVRSKLDAKSIKFVEHYIKHAEYEMAFEGLFIEIMKIEDVPKIDLIKSRKVAKLLKLDEESVFDDGFWNKFEQYILENS